MPPNPKPKPKPNPNSLLSPAAYDDDASSLRSLSEQDSDTEDDEFLRNSRSTLELTEHDRSVLEEEEELEKLLTKGGGAGGLRRIFSGNGGGSGSGRVRIGRRERRGRRRGEEDRNGVSGEGSEGERGELMFEMEERYTDQDRDRDYDEDGDGDEGEEDGLVGRVGTPALEMGTTKRTHTRTRTRTRIRIPWRRFLFVFATILVLLLILLLGAYKASSGFRSSRHDHRKGLRSNGTALFAPTTILISLDGFRADFLNRGLTPILNSFIASGVSPRYMLPSFPSVTFPNHFTLVTGLYPESHGIVGNSFWDPEFQETFYYTRQEISMQSKWWNAEPLWVTAEKQGVTTAVHMWPGSEAHIEDLDPTFLDKYNGSEALARKVGRILDLLDLPGEEGEQPGDTPRRPQFIAAYVPNVDADGHKYGPNSTEIRSTISSVDDMLGSLFAGIQDRNLTDIVNIVIVSDHGMATTSTERLVQLDDLIDMNLVEHINGWPSRGIRPKRPEDLPVLESQLSKVAADYPHAIEIYTRETMPERYHFSNNDRIAPLWVIPKAGWAVVERPDFDAREALQNGITYRPRGIHGYDHEHPLMRSIFVARGPAFPHPSNSRLEVFQNIEVYNMICDSLGVEPRPNNGTLRLPLRPLGLHSDEEAPAMESVEDPPVSSVSASVVPTIVPSGVSSEMVPSEATPLEPTSVEVPGATSMPDPTQTPAPESDAGSEDEGDDESSEDNNQETDNTWWQAIWDKLHDLKEWASEVFAAEKDNQPS